MFSSYIIIIDKNDERRDRNDFILKLTFLSTVILANFPVGTPKLSM